MAMTLRVTNGKIGTSEFILMAILCIWAGFSTVYSMKLLAIDNPECRWIDPQNFNVYLLHFSSVCCFTCCTAIIGFLNAALKVTEEVNQEEKEESHWKRIAVACVMTTILPLGVLVSFLIVLQQGRTCPNWVTIVHSSMVALVGCALISFTRNYKSCYGLFLCLLGGAVFTCYKAFGNRDPLVFQLMVCSALLSTMLCGLHFCLRAMELASKKKMNKKKKKKMPSPAYDELNDLHQSLLL